MSRIVHRINSHYVPKNNFFRAFPSSHGRCVSGCCCRFVAGTKEWSLYHPDKDLPREYSRDFKQNEIGDAFLTVRLEPGDFMYFPRGIIHQARASEEFSHHLTVSTFQKHSWYDLLNIALPEALEKAFAEGMKFPRSLSIPMWRGEFAARSWSLEL